MTLDEWAELYKAHGLDINQEAEGITFQPGSSSGGVIVLRMDMEGLKAIHDLLPETWTFSDGVYAYYLFRGNGTKNTRSNFVFIDKNPFSLPIDGSWDSGPPDVEIADLPKSVIDFVTVPITLGGPGVQYDGTNGSFRPQKTLHRWRMMSADVLDKKDIPPKQWIIADMLPEGLAVIAAPPKSYKSYLALSMCVCVSQGKPFFGHATTQAGCLYLDLESSDIRPRDRLRQIMHGNEKPSDLYLVTAEDEVMRIGEGLEAQLEASLDERPNIKLVVIDVFQLIKPPKKRGLDAYESDYEALKSLNSIAKKRHICILLIHHTKKGRDSSDVFNNMSGSMAMSGAMDTIMLISRESRSDDNAVLTVSGRDIAPQELSIRWNAIRFMWEYLGSQEDVAWNKLKGEYDNSNLIKAVKRLLNDNSGEWTGSASDIKSSSHFTQYQLHDRPEKISKDIERFEELLMLDGISFVKDREGHTGKRVFKFRVSAPSSLTALSSVSAPSA